MALKIVYPICCGIATIARRRIEYLLFAAVTFVPFMNSATILSVYGIAQFYGVDPFLLLCIRTRGT